MENTLVYFVIGGLVGLLIQYLIIKAAVSVALEEHSKKEIKDRYKYDNLITALGVNPSEYHDLDDEAAKVFTERLKSLRKEKTYRKSSIPEQYAKQDKLKAQIFAEFNERKLRINKNDHES